MKEIKQNEAKMYSEEEQRAGKRGECSEEVGSRRKSYWRRRVFRPKTKNIKSTKCQRRISRKRGTIES